MNTNTTICELILTNRGQTINVDGYLMVKDKNRSNSYYVVKDETHLHANN